MGAVESPTLNKYALALYIDFKPNRNLFKMWEGLTLYWWDQQNTKRILNQKLKLAAGSGFAFAVMRLVQFSGGTKKGIG